MSDPVIAKIQANPKYKELQTKRSSFGWDQATPVKGVVRPVSGDDFVAVVLRHKAFDDDPQMRRRLKGEAEKLKAFGMSQWRVNSPFNA